MTDENINYRHSYKESKACQHCQQKQYNVKPAQYTCALDHERIDMDMVCDSFKRR